MKKVKKKTAQEKATAKKWFFYLHRADIIKTLNFVLKLHKEKLKKKKTDYEFKRNKVAFVDYIIDLINNAK